MKGIEQFFSRVKRKSIEDEGSSSQNKSLKQNYEEFNLDDLPSDPGERKKIQAYHPNDHDKIRRAYLEKGPCQPRDHNFPRRAIGQFERRFVPTWFDDYKDWLEYSISKDAAFCLCCYLYGKTNGEQGGGDRFVIGGFTNWKKKEKFDQHVGTVGSAHREAWSKCEDLLNQKQHIPGLFEVHDVNSNRDYRTRLTASLNCVRLLLRQGLTFRGNDESEESLNKGNFRELLDFLGDHNEDIKNAMKNARRNAKMYCPEIQKDLVRASAMETTREIIKDLGDEPFAILLDESRDVSIREQMAIVLRYVDNKGRVVEHFLAIEQVEDTKALSLKVAVEGSLLKHNLCISRLRGQGYDGASNMKGELNGLKTLIMKENPSAYYVHCFAHQLQLALVAVAQKKAQIADFFNTIAKITNMVGASCKRRELLRQKRCFKVIESLGCGEIPSGTGLNQERGLQRGGDTRWGSHYRSLTNLSVMFSSVLEVLEFIEQDGQSQPQEGEAYSLINIMSGFEFAFILHLMINVLAITNELSLALQRKDQDILNAMILVKGAKQQMQHMRDDGWSSLMDDVSSFCEKHDIPVPSMDDVYGAEKRPRRNRVKTTNHDHYQFDLFNDVVDWQLQELNHRFDEVNTELLLCVACLNPSDSFAAFDKEKLVCLAKFYPSDFSEVDLRILDKQLDTFIFDMKSSVDFLTLKGIGELSQKMVEKKRHLVYPLVYLLVKLALILPVSTASVERVFSAMKIVKSRLRNKMGNQWMNDCLVTLIEKEIFCSVDNERILSCFQNMKTRREQL